MLCQKGLKRWLSNMQIQEKYATLLKLSPPFNEHLIISTFSCSYDDFERDVTGFITDMGKGVVSDHEFVKVNDHKSHLLMNVLDMDELCTEMTSDKAKEWDKANNCEDTVYVIDLVE